MKTLKMLLSLTNSEQDRPQKPEEASIAEGKHSTIVCGDVVADGLLLSFMSLLGIINEKDVDLYQTKRMLVQCSPAITIALKTYSPSTEPMNAKNHIREIRL